MENYTKEDIKTICKNLNTCTKNDTKETIAEIQNILNLACVGVICSRSMRMFFVDNGKIYTNKTLLESDVYDTLENGQYMRIKLDCRDSKHFFEVYREIKEKFYRVIHSTNKILCIVKL